jgi:hypothetical protein
MHHWPETIHKVLPPHHCCIELHDVATMLLLCTAGPRAFISVSLAYHPVPHAMLCPCHAMLCCAGHQRSTGVPAVVHRPSGPDHGWASTARVHVPGQHQQHMAAARLLDAPAPQPQLCAAPQCADHRAGSRGSRGAGGIQLQHQQVCAGRGWHACVVSQTYKGCVWIDTMCVCVHTVCVRVPTCG